MLESRIRYEAEAQVLGGLARVAEHPSASGGKKVGYLDDASSFLEFHLWVPQKGEYLLSARVGNGTDEMTKVGARYATSVNGKRGPELFAVHTRWNAWVVVPRRVTLEAGDNTLRVTRLEGFMARVPGGSVPDGSYRLIADHADKALDVAGCEAKDGAPVSQAANSEMACQAWRLEAP